MQFHRLAASLGERGAVRSPRLAAERWEFASGRRRSTTGPQASRSTFRGRGIFGAAQGPRDGPRQPHCQPVQPGQCPRPHGCDRENGRAAQLQKQRGRGRADEVACQGQRAGQKPAHLSQRSSRGLPGIPRRHAGSSAGNGRTRPGGRSLRLSAWQGTAASVLSRRAGFAYRKYSAWLFARQPQVAGWMMIRPDGLISRSWPWISPDCAGEWRIAPPSNGRLPFPSMPRYAGPRTGHR
jgi:hypothetical protein